MSNMLLMQTEEVRSLANQTINCLDDLETRVSNVASEVANLDWVAPGRNSYIYEFQQTAQTIRQLLEEGRELYRRANQESQRWEVMAGELASSVPAVSNSSPAVGVDTILDSLSDACAWASGFVVSSAINLSRKELRPGISAIEGSKKFKRYIMGLKPGTTVMGQAKFFGRIDKVVNRVAIFGAIFDAAGDVYQYRDQGVGMIGSSLVVNGLVFGVGLAAAAIIGTASAPAAIAGVAVGIALDCVMDLKVGPNGETVEDQAVKGVYEAGEFISDNAVDFYQEISNSVSQISSWVRDPGVSTSGNGAQ